MHPGSASFTSHRGRRERIGARPVEAALFLGSLAPYGRLRKPFTTFREQSRLCRDRSRSRQLRLRPSSPKRRSRQAQSVDKAGLPKIPLCASPGSRTEAARRVRRRSNTPASAHVLTPNLTAFLASELARVLWREWACAGRRSGRRFARPRDAAPNLNPGLRTIKRSDGQFASGAGRGAVL